MPSPAKKNAVMPKKLPAKKPTATAKKNGRAKVDERFAKQGAELQALVAKKMPLPEAAKKLGMSVGKAQRLLARVALKPGDLVRGPDAEVAKAIVRLHDEEGLPFVPDIWARVPGLSGAKIKELYELAKPSAPGGRQVL